MTAGAATRAVVAGLVLAAGTVPAVPAAAPGPEPPLVALCIHLDLGVLLPPLTAHLHVDVAGGTACHPPPTTTTTPPPTTTSTTVPPTTTTTTTTTLPPATTTSSPPPTTTTTAPPPTTTATTTTAPPTTAPLPPTTTAPAPPAPTTTVPPAPEPPSVPPPSPARTTTTTSAPAPTTTRTTTPRPTPPPDLAVAARLEPRRPAPGQLATAVLTVRNDGDGPARAVRLRDDVTGGAELRSAWSPDGCTVSGRRADCLLGDIAPGAAATTEVRLLIAPAGRAGTVTQRIRLGTSQVGGVTTRSVAADLGEPTGGQDLPTGPGTAVTVGTTFAMVLAARRGRPRSDGAR